VPFPTLEHSNHRGDAGGGGSFARGVLCRSSFRLNRALLSCLAGPVSVSISLHSPPPYLPTTHRPIASLSDSALFSRTLDAACQHAVISRLSSPQVPQNRAWKISQREEQLEVYERRRADARLVVERRRLSRVPPDGHARRDGQRAVGVGRRLEPEHVHRRPEHRRTQKRPDVVGGK
jgi:hypothetical protein